MRGRATLIALICAAPFSAAAATLPIDGSYGNKPGCHYAKTEESSGADVFLLLTPESVTTATAYCEVKSVGKTTNGTIDAVLACQAEGEEGETALPARIIPEGKSAYKISFEDGTIWGPLPKCL